MIMSTTDIWNRLTKCDTGERLNPLMHIFLYLTFVFSFAFVFGIGGVTESALYMETFELGINAVNSWGMVGLATTLLHTIGILWRGKYGIQLMRLSIFGGFYLWLWAAIVYFLGGFYFQLLVGAIPNLAFWTWYAWNWRKRYNNLYDSCVAAFVN